MQIFVGVYRKQNSSQHILTCLLDEWKKKADQNKIVGAVSFDLFEDFYCIPYEFLIAELDAYGFNKEVLSLMHLYLKFRKESVRLDN